MDQHAGTRPTAAGRLFEGKARTGALSGSTSLDWAAAKAKVLKAYEASAPGEFKKFFATPLFDQLANICALCFCARFQADALRGALDKARRQHQEGLRPDLVLQRVEELRQEADAYVVQLAPVYAQLLLRYSQHRQTHQDRLFFETLYEALIALLVEAFGAKRREAVEVGIGDLFRTPAFNLYARRARPPRSIDTLALRELYAVKHSASFLNSKMLLSLYEQEKSTPVQTACVANTPLIASFIKSPAIMARAARALAAAQSDVEGQFTAALGSPAVTARRGTQAAAGSGGEGARRGLAGGAPLSTLPVHVDAGGMVADDSTQELVALRRALLRRVNGGSTGSRASNASLRHTDQDSVRSGQQPFPGPTSSLQPPAIKAA